MIMLTILSSLVIALFFIYSFFVMNEKSNYVFYCRSEKVDRYSCDTYYYCKKTFKTKKEIENELKDFFDYCGLNFDKFFVYIDGEDLKRIKKQLNCKILFVPQMEEYIEDTINLRNVFYWYDEYMNYNFKKALRAK